MTRTPQQTQESQSSAMIAGGGGGEWFGAAIARTPIGLALVDRQARVHHANSSFLRLFVADSTEAAFSLVDEVDTRDRARVLTLIADAVTGTTSSAPIEVRMRSNEQRSVWIYASVSHGGGPAELVISAVDVTEVRRLDRQQLVAEKLQAVRQLAAGLAHNLNNRVTSIVGNVDLLLERSDGNDPAGDEIIEIRRGVDQVAELVQGLSAFTDQPAAALEPVDLNAVVIDLEPLLDRVVGSDIAISIDVAVEPLNVRADRPQLEQVLIDLAISTRERMPEGGTLSVRARAATVADLGWDAKDGYRCIEFVDSGRALPDEQLERMFEPFYSPSGPFASANLGLAAGYGIIKQFGGEIVAADAAGSGTAMRVMLPIVGRDDADEKPDDTVNTQPMTGTTAATLTVLVVEDELPVRRFAARALGKRGYDVVEAENGDVALEILDDLAMEVDLVLSDVMMPGMDGATLLREIRARRPRAKIIMVSGYGENILQGILDQYEGVVFLPKPFTLDELIARVDDVMG